MTNRDAIGILKHEMYDQWEYPLRAEALTMAIKALEQESCNLPQLAATCEDAVSLSAIEWHDMLVADGNGQYHNERVAYKSQIDDLSPVTPKLVECEDAVSREAVYNAMVEKGQHSRRYKLSEIWELNGDEIREALDTVPSITPKQRTGEWIDSNGNKVKMKNGKPVSSCWCSKCGEWLTASDEYDVRGLYCPNCGAKMNAERKTDDSV